MAAPTVKSQRPQSKGPATPVKIAVAVVGGLVLLCLAMTLIIIGPAKGFASHGESWSLALSLKLATFALLRGDGEDPILVLDDVFATLDADRRAALAAVARTAEQTLITAAVLDDVPPELRGTRVEVAGGRAWVVAEGELVEEIP